MQAVWMNILRQKFMSEENKSIGKVLMNTEDVYLLEFSRTAKYQYDKGTNTYWAGIVKNDVLYGENQMRKYLMKIR